MKFLTKNSLPRKIIISILIALILIFSVAPSYNNVVYAAEASGEDPDSGGVAGALLKELLNLVVQLGDIAMGALNHFMLGTEGFSSAMLSPDNSNIDNPDSWLYVPKNERSGDDVESYTSEQINTANFFAWAGEHDYEIPNMLYSPEEIFANDVAALDVNFLRPNSYTAVADGDKAQEAAQSAAGGKLRDAISSWYKAFRNIAVVGLLSVLVYLGIRILISSTSVDKAKYKESLQDWLVALCLVFIIHFIMSGILMLTDRFTELIDSSIDDGIIVEMNAESNAPVYFRTNLLGFIRFNAQSFDFYNTVAYSIIYMVMVIYTCIFTFTYFKRFLYMAFFTMIAPLVALTYPIDRARRWKSTSL